jgi:putative acetyltransferase
MDLLLPAAAVRAGDPEVSALLEQLTAELADAGYTSEQTFGYSVRQLEEAGVHLVGVRRGDRLVGIGGVELQADGLAELKRFYVVPEHRGSGIADAMLTALVDHARERGAAFLRLETGDKQGAAIAFYRRHGFVEVPRFGPYTASTTSVCMQRQLAAS